MTTASLDRQLAEQRLQSAISLVDGLFSVDWPYADASTALKHLRDGFKVTLDELHELDDDAGREVIIQHCLKARSVIYDYLGFVGFILRSADVRNSFEIYSPLKEIGGALLGDQFHLILGSEWNYSPYVYPLPTTALADFILVGLPASEAQNALLVPVAGHELGHAIWRRTALGRGLTPDIQRETIRVFEANWDSLKDNFSKDIEPQDLEGDLIARSIWTPSFQSALRQCEEVFCDLVGLWIFGSSFLHSFRYLLSPDTTARVSRLYPLNKARAKYLIDACSALSVELPPDFLDAFRDPDEPDALLAAADTVTTTMLPKLIESAATYCASRGLKRPRKTKTAQVSQHLRSLSPSRGDATIAEILNAAWDIRLNIDNWDVPGVASQRRFLILNDLVLKSFEVMEWQKRPPATPQANT